MHVQFMCLFIRLSILCAYNMSYNFNPGILLLLLLLKEKKIAQYNNSIRQQQLDLMSKMLHQLVLLTNQHQGQGGEESATTNKKWRCAYKCDYCPAFFLSYNDAVINENVCKRLN